MPVSYSGPPTAEGMQAHTTPSLLNWWTRRESNPRP